ncbi:MAG: hypothetical protein ACE5KX_00380 [Acidimicrobiia bacterium]
MPIVSTESAGAPIEFGDKTITPVARIKMWSFSTHRFALFRASARPDRLRVEEPDGRHRTIRIANRSNQVRMAIWVTVLAVIMIARLKRGSNE